MSENDPTDPEAIRRVQGMLQTDETVLRAALARARAEFEHKGLKGDALERSLRELLSKRLPMKFRVGTGEVIDRHGGRSSQLDVIVLTEDQPFVHSDDESGTYIVEGVASVGEVKTRLDGKELDDILAKGSKIRALRPTHLQGDKIYTNPSDRERYVNSIAYFALAVESALSSETILSRLRGDEGVPNFTGVELPRLDALVVLDQGIYYNFGDGEGAHQFAVDGESVGGWIGPFAGQALVDLFVWINATAPRIERNQSVLPHYLA